MRVPDSLAHAFDQLSEGSFEKLISTFSVEKGLIPDEATLVNERFLARSVVPHIKKLSALFNRVEEEEQSKTLDPYWKESSNPANLRLAYFLYFMPSNMFRVASVWTELSRLGFKWPEGKPFRGIEFGAGPASGACGIAAGEKAASLGLPKTGNWALIEQDKAMLQLGASWAEKFFTENLGADWGIRPFHRKLDLSQGFLPRNAPTFNLWVMSYFLNEFWDNPALLAGRLMDAWDRHLDEGGIVILVEPALKSQSRKLLELRRELLEVKKKREIDWFQVLLPCLGHQECGALAEPEDWCHEDVVWWRPSYFKVIDRMAGLDRKSLPYSYLVITKDRRPRTEILSGLKGVNHFHRLVSPSFSVGQDLEFYLCGLDGKRRCRLRPKADTASAEINRGDIVCDARIRGDSASSRIEHFSGIS